MVHSMRRSFNGLTAVALLILARTSTLSADDVPLEATIQLDVVKQELNAGFCWFHPRVAAIPGRRAGGGPLVVMTIQKHLVADDHYSGLYYLKSADLGKTWSEPVLPKEVDWRKDGDATVAVADVTPGWHAKTGRLIAIGIKVRYSEKGAQLVEKPRSYDFSYAVYDPESDRWTAWRELDMPLGEGERFHQLAPGCGQWLVKSDGTVLVPLYFQGPKGGPYSTTVIECSFDGIELKYQKHGSLLALNDARGIYEPSLAYFQGRYWLTLRNDSRGYLATSTDGLSYSPIEPWTFDDGTDLGSYNTQQHWVVHSDGLFLAYTRRGANNDHIARNRAPLFLARVDPEKRHVLRATEKVLMPERGVMLGNFGAAAITPDESWVTDSEFLVGEKPHVRGANGSTFAARVKWSRPSWLSELVPGPKPLRIVALGDSITKGVRSGVTVEQTFAALVQQRLTTAEQRAEVANVGIGGERTDGALARLDRDVLAKKPHVVLVMYGTNDSYVDKGASASRLTTDEYRKNLETLIAKLTAAGITPVLMTEPRWGKGAKNGLGEDPNIRLEPYLEIVRAVAKEKNLKLVDHYQIWTDAEKNGQDLAKWTTDLCHPNPAGHESLADAIVKAMSSVESPTE